MEKQKLTTCFIGTAESIHMLKWAKYFLEKGHKVYLVSYDPLLENYDPKNIKLYFLKRKVPIQIWPFNTLLNLPTTLIKVKKLIKKIKPDIIHAHYITSYGHLVAMSGFHPLVVTAWGSDILIAPKESLKSKLIVKYVLRKTDLITCDAEHMKKAMVELGANESKIKIINFGIDSKRFSPGTKDEKLKEELEASNCKIVISLRSLEPIYDVETLIKAIPPILKGFPQTKFIIAGEGSQKENLEELANELKITEAIKFIGRIPNENLPNYLRIADIYVSTSLSDGGIASSTAEAMSCGLPVIITDVADNRKWVNDGENGFVVPVKNHELLAEKITYLLRNEQARKEFGMKNREIIKERNDYSKEMAKMEEIYYELVNKSKL